MTNISIIVAVAADRAIGRQGDMPFYIREDLRHFKQTTMGKPIIMGHKTFLSLPKGALPGRRNIVITRNAAFEAPGAETASSLDEAISLAGNVDEIMIIGGGEIYSQAMPMASRLYLTRIEAEVPDADTFFPEIDPEQWSVVDQSQPHTDEPTGLVYTFMTLQRR